MTIPTRRMNPIWLAAFSFCIPANGGDNAVTPSNAGALNHASAQHQDTDFLRVWPLTGQSAAELPPFSRERLLIHSRLISDAARSYGLIAQSSNPSASPQRPNTAPLDVPKTPQSVRITRDNASSLKLKVLARIRGNAYQVDSTADSHTITVLPVGVDRGVIFIDIETGAEAARCTANYGSYAVSGSGRVVAGAVGGTLQLCDPLSPADAQTLQPSSTDITCLGFSPNGQFLGTGHNDGTIRLWSPTKRELLWTSAAQSSPVAKVSVAPDGKHLAAAYRDSSVRYWDTGANSSLQAPPSTQAAAGEYVRMLSFLMGGRKILVGLKSGTWLWDLSAAPSAVRRFPQGADAVSPDERIAVTLGQYVGLGAQGYTPLTLWDLNTGGEITTVNTARGMLAVSAAFTRDGTALLASTNAGEILVWRP